MSDHYLIDSPEMSEINYEQMGRRIRNYRKAKGHTQEYVAGQIGVTLTHYCRIERGTKPSLETLVRIADFLDASLDEIIGRRIQLSPIVSAVLKLFSDHDQATQLEAYKGLCAEFKYLEEHDARDHAIRHLTQAEKIEYIKKETDKLLAAESASRYHPRS